MWGTGTRAALLGKGGRRSGTHGIEVSEDGLQEKVEFCDWGRQSEWDRCVPGLAGEQPVGGNGVRMGDGAVSFLGPFPSAVLSHHPSNLVATMSRAG